MYFTRRTPPRLRHILRIALTITLMAVSGLLLGCKRADAAEPGSYLVPAATMERCSAEGGCLLVTRKAFAEIATSCKEAAQ